MKTRTRRIGAVAVGAGLLLSLAGCAREPTKPDGKPAIAFVLPSTQSNFTQEMAIGFRWGARQVGGVDFTVAGPPRLDNAGEAKILQDLIESNKAADGISLYMQAADLFAPVIARAHEKDIPMIAVNGRMDPSAKVELFVGNDEVALGRMLADEAIKKLPANASGKVILGTPVPGAPVLDLRARGMREEFAKRLPNVDVLGPFDTKQDPLVNKTAWESLVRANPDALAFLGTGNADSFNLASIRKSKHAKWVAGGFDLDPRSLRAVKEGQIVLVSPEHYVKGAIAGRLQAEHAKTGEALPKGWVYTPGLAINDSNIDEIMQRQASEAAREAWFKPHIEEILGDQKTYLRPLDGGR